jgi:hypothetical protein
MPAAVSARATGRATIAQGTLSGPDDWSTYWGPVPDATHWIRSRLVAFELVWLQRNRADIDRAQAFRFACVCTAIAGAVCGWGSAEYNWNMGRLFWNDGDREDFFGGDDDAQYRAFTGPMNGATMMVSMIALEFDAETRAAMFAGAVTGVRNASLLIDHALSANEAATALRRVYAAIPADVLRRYGMPATVGAASSNGGGGNHASTNTNTSQTDTNPDVITTNTGRRTNTGGAILALGALALWLSTRRKS